MSFSQLDLSQLYVQSRHSFYVEGGTRPDAFNLDQGLSGEVGRAVHRRTDPHFVLSLDRDSYHEVSLTRGDKRLQFTLLPAQWDTE